MPEVCSRACSWAVVLRRAGSWQCELCWAGSLVSQPGTAASVLRSQDFISSDVTPVPAAGTATQPGKWDVWQEEKYLGLWNVYSSGDGSKARTQGLQSQLFPCQQLCECTELCAATLGCSHSSQRAYPKSLQAELKVYATRIQWQQVSNPRIWEGKEEIRYYFGLLCHPPQVILCSQTR